MTKIKLFQTLFVLLFVFFHFFSFSQQNRIDSLQKIVQAGIEDTNRVNALNELSKIAGWQVGDYDTAKYYANSAQILAKKLSYNKGIASFHNNIGMISNNMGNYSEALKNHQIALSIRKQIQHKKGIADSYNNIGIVQANQGDYPEALKNYFTALKIYEEIGNKQRVALAYGNIGIIYYNQSNYSEALKNYYAALKVRGEIGDKNGSADSYNNIGGVYHNQANYTEAIKNYYAALKIREEIGDKRGIAASYSNIGLAYLGQGNYSEAAKNNFEALKIRQKVGDKNGVAISYNNIGSVYIEMGNPKEGKLWQQKALSLAKEIGVTDIIVTAYLAIANADKALGNYKGAYENYTMHIIYRDSLVNEANTKKTLQLQMQYEFDKKETAFKAEQEKKDVITEKEKQKQQLFFWLMVAVAAAVTVIAVVIFRAFFITRKQKKIIEAQKTKVETQNQIIEEKNRDITSSINYARLIQKAMLPHRKDIWAAFTNSFVLFKPKDIVSGDFYFFTPINSFNYLIAVADCTGHGVPGGFMTMLGTERLTDAAKQGGNSAEILALLNKGIKKSLKQNGENASRDGMDIALCCVDTLNRTVQYAGANRPLWIIRKDVSEIEEIKATKRGIGGFTEDEQQFEQHTISLREGDAFYIFSDGYADLFGKSGKKITTKRFKQLLIDVKDKPMKEQGKYLEEYAEDWQSGVEQIDDVLVIGIKL